MRIERRHVRRESSGELAARKREAREAGREAYPGREVEVHAYYGGDFYLAVWARGEGSGAAEVVRV